MVLFKKRKRELEKLGVYQFNKMNPMYSEILRDIYWILDSLKVLEDALSDAEDAMDEVDDDDGCKKTEAAHLRAIRKSLREMSGYKRQTKKENPPVS